MYTPDLIICVLSNIWGRVDEIADLDFQNRCWVLGQTKEVSSFEELINDLEGNIEPVITHHERYYISFELSEQLASLWSMLDQYVPPVVYDDGYANPESIVNDPYWKEISIYAKSIEPNLKERIIQLAIEYQHQDLIHPDWIHSKQ